MARKKTKASTIANRDMRAAKESKKQTEAALFRAAHDGRNKAQHKRYLKRHPFN